jgi:hypothetical protein
MVVSLVCKERGLINLCARYTHERFPTSLDPCHNASSLPLLQAHCQHLLGRGKGGLICWPENGERGVYGREPTSMICERETGIWARKCRA